MLASLREVANIIAGRVRNSLKDRHQSVQCTLPDARRVAGATDWPLRTPSHRSDCFFRVRDADLELLSGARLPRSAVTRTTGTGGSRADAG